MSGIVKDKKTVTLKGWQQDIIDEIESHDEKRDSQVCQGMADLSLNRSLSVNVAMPRGSGHTFLANYIASVYPSALVYGKMNHYKEVTAKFPLNSNTETFSIYEIFYGMYKQDHQPAADLMEIRKKFEDKRVVVVDRAMGVSDDIKNFIYDSARCIVVMLGH